MTDQAAPQIALAFAGTDRQRGEALSRILASLGYTIAPQPVTAASVDDSAAVITLWSSASINSGPIHALATQASVQRKLVCVKTTASDPPAAFSLVNLYDLSNWTGSSDAPAIRDLIEHLVRKAPPPMPVPRPPPVSAPFFVSRIAEPVRAPVVARAISGHAPAKLAEPPSAEAIAWRQILTSGEPADFREHLEIFGDHGVYAEAARQRLAELEAARRAAPPPTVSPAQAKAALAKAASAKSAASKARRHRGPNFAALTLATFAIGAVAALTYYLAAPLLRGAPAPVAAVSPAPAAAVIAPVVVAPAPVEAVRAAPLEEIASDIAATAPPVATSVPVAATPAEVASAPATAAVKAAPKTARPKETPPAAAPTPAAPARTPLILPTALEGVPSAGSATGATSVNFSDQAPATTSANESSLKSDPPRTFKRMEAKAAPE